MKVLATGSTSPPDPPSDFCGDGADTVSPYVYDACSDRDKGLQPSWSSRRLVNLKLPLFLRLVAACALLITPCKIASHSANTRTVEHFRSSRLSSSTTEPC